MSERKIIGSKPNPEYEAAPYEWCVIDSQGRTLSPEQGGLLWPYRYATKEHALNALQPGADPRINSVCPVLPIYEGDPLP